MSNGNITAKYTIHNNDFAVDMKKLCKFSK